MAHAPPVAVAHSRLPSSTLTGSPLGHFFTQFVKKSVVQFTNGADAKLGLGVGACGAEPRVRALCLEYLIAVACFPV